MNASEAQAGYHPAYQEAATTKAFSGSAIMESLGALATIATAIVGLTATFSTEMAAIATIVLGAAVWIEGGGFDLLSRILVTSLQLRVAEFSTKASRP